ncbi:MAG: glycosyltransferase family 2 protein [Paracoccaceae bacterium]
MKFFGSSVELHCITNTPPSALPNVTVLIPVHNGLPYLEQALRSIMTQTLRSIEILVIDDASTDGSPGVLARLAAEDPRIRVETLPSRYKLPRALNHGLTLARAPLIARMDADDIALPQRLEIQKRYMDAHPDVVLTGGGIRRIRADGSTIRETIRSNDDFAVRWLIKFRLSIAHPTWMMQNPMLSENGLAYDPAFSVTEDHEFVSRLLHHGKIVGIPALLLEYRVHDNSVTSRNWAFQTEQAEKIFDFCVQNSYPDSVLSKFGALRAAHFRRKRANSADVIAGFLAMLDHDTAHHPNRRAWLMRQGTQLIYETLRRAGYTRYGALLALLRHAPGLLTPLVLRALETQNLLPRFMDSEPAV